MTARTRKLITMTGTILLLIAGIVGINYVSTMYSTKWDATAEQAFTLSEDTRRVFKQIDQPTVMSFFPLPAHVTRTAHTRRNRRAIRDLLREYAAQSDLLSLQVLPPAQFAEQVKQLADRHEGLDESDLMQREPVLIRQPGTGAYRLIPFDQIRPIRSDAGQKKNEDPSISFRWGERALTSALYSITRERRITICVQGGHGEEKSNDAPSNRRTFTSVKRELTNREGFRLTYPSELDELDPSTCDLLLLLPGANTQPDMDRSSIRSYINNGGSVIVLAESDMFDDLRDVLQNFGIELTNTNLPESPAQMGLPSSIERVEWYRSHPITSTLLEMDTPVYMQGAQLVKTNEDHTMHMTPSILLGARRNRTELQNTDPHLTSELVSGNQGTALPVAAVSQHSKSREQDQAGKLVVFGDSDWVSDALLSKLSTVDQSGNMPLFLNTVRWSAGISEERRIIPEPRTNPTIIVTEAKAGAIFTLVVLLIPGCFFLLGTMVWWLRRMRH